MQEEKLVELFGWVNDTAFYITAKIEEYPQEKAEEICVEAGRRSLQGRSWMKQQPVFPTNFGGECEYYRKTMTAREWICLMLQQWHWWKYQSNDGCRGKRRKRCASKLHIYHTQQGAVIRPGKETMDQTGTIISKTPAKKKKNYKPSIYKIRITIHLLLYSLNGTEIIITQNSMNIIFSEARNRIHSERGVKVWPFASEHHLTGMAAVHRCQETQKHPVP